MELCACIVQFGLGAAGADGQQIGSLERGEGACEGQEFHYCTVLDCYLGHLSREELPDFEGLESGIQKLKIERWD